MTTKIIMRKTVYPEKTLLEFAYNSLELAQYEFDRVGLVYEGGIVKPIKHKWGKYWVIIDVPSWWIGKNK